MLSLKKFISTFVIKENFTLYWKVLKKAVPHAILSWVFMSFYDKIVLICVKQSPLSHADHKKLNLRNFALYFSKTNTRPIAIATVVTKCLCKWVAPRWSLEAPPSSVCVCVHIGRLHISRQSLQTRANVGLLLGQHRRRWSSIKPTSTKHLVFATDVWCKKWNQICTRWNLHGCYDLKSSLLLIMSLFYLIN